MKKISLILLFLFVFSQFGICEVTNEIRYNGRLKSYTMPSVGERILKFEYYDASSGGKFLGEEIHNVTPTADGVFSVILRPDINWQKENNVWLQLSVDSKPMSPREKIMSQPFAQHSKTSDNGVPPGTVIAFAGPTANAPKGYLLCNGVSVSKNDYPDLFEAIGTTYGGDGIPYFNLPNFQGVFLRGRGSQTVSHGTYGNITHSAGNLGQVQGDAIRNISGQFKYERGELAMNLTGPFYSSPDSGTQYGAASGGQITPNINFDSSRVVPVANENRPVNYAVNYYIKY
ncbi:MAG: phage tail protein [Endomicrobia bacterium]|nr:phage tail protein [Endomicrobiia bacterium]MCL2506089.1 phage tail protein [Endomicrobiia bacterium]